MANVSIVLISHSSKVVEGIQEIITEVNNSVSIALAGGTDDGEIGTSIEKIQSAIDSVYSNKGVLLIYDLGSAKMNAEMVIELMALEKVQILEVPILEGAYVAAVEAGMGKDLVEVVKAVEKSF